MVNVVNMVGSGSLDLEIDLETLSEEIGQPRTRYDPDKYPGMYLRFKEDDPLITVYSALLNPQTALRSLFESPLEVVEGASIFA